VGWFHYKDDDASKYRSKQFNIATITNRFTTPLETLVPGGLMFYC